MTATQIGALALALGAFGLLLLGIAALRRASATSRAERALNDALDRRMAALEAARTRPAGEEDAAAKPDARRSQRVERLLERLSAAGMRWLDTGLGKHVVAEEDRRLLEQCGYVDARTRGLFLSARLAMGVGLPLLFAIVASGRVSGGYWMIGMCAAFGVGFMLPKLYIRRRAAARRQSVGNELPLLVDMLRLLQGVGLSLDQSLQVVTNDFRGMLPVLSSEVGIAQRQFAAGRTREQSLQRLSSGFDNEDLRAVVRLMIQVDKHGGAVQEPLKQFGDRLRETRRALLRERIGRLTVKMTGVMVLTLLPALLIVTAGPRMLAVMRALSPHH
ncbi:type II secretion system F family protein [Burkholderia multivorans]|uniref:type II secretion system F family protein n=1 Tax=Burkholderia multivorans TaxID=87883 RepID=UPI000277D11F|nr:type II secretion system F family protein [Burkholderia multivorans]AJY17979.1 type II secretion system (T2SS), F family protein [Burkholderia multivorans ATCC BAA-247]AVR21983.1 type II secretion system F family protein [Burkholderia multivorans]EJO56129.1 type II secretion system F domain protein [Burkholderia multivorans ATCC BAA-247]SAK17733.1 type II secretion system (T2SS), F family protein [Burkholderia multivorans]SPV03868.1 type II secretion system protein [Burkholderia multivorans